MRAPPLSRGAWRRTLGTVALVALMMSAPGAAAQEDNGGLAFGETAEGVVGSVDPERRLLTLKDGATFLLAEAVDAEEIGVGESVFIVYRFDDREQKIAVEVLLADQR